MKDWRGRNLDEKPSRGKDLEALRKLLADGIANAAWRDAFSSMLHSLEHGERVMLSERQREWVMSVLDEIEPSGYENLVSRGLVSGRTKVETLPMLRSENLPKRPPTRRRDDDG
jgi:hypothetical protein